MLQLIGFTIIAKVLVLKSYRLACEKAVPGVRGWGREKGKSPFPSLSLPPTPRTPTPLTLSSTFLCRSLHYYDVKPTNATFYGGCGHTTTNFPFSSVLNLDKVLKKSTPGKIAHISQIERV